MKATELMIGDWVKSRTGMNVKIVGISHDYPCVYEPIPLTAEILEKNGFVFRENNDIMCGEYYLHNQSTFAIKMFNGYLVGMCMGEDLEFHYVHELQHALRLCGLNELADNFKI